MSGKSNGVLYLGQEMPKRPRRWYQTDHPTFSLFKRSAKGLTMRCKVKSKSRGVSIPGGKVTFMSPPPLFHSHPPSVTFSRPLFKTIFDPSVFWTLCTGQSAFLSVPWVPGILGRGS